MNVMIGVINETRVRDQADERRRDGEESGKKE